MDTMVDIMALTCSGWGCHDSCLKFVATEKTPAWFGSWRELMGRSHIGEHFWVNHLNSWLHSHPEGTTPSRTYVNRNTSSVISQPPPKPLAGCCWSPVLLLVFQKDESSATSVRFHCCVAWLRSFTFPASAPDLGNRWWWFATAHLVSLRSSGGPLLWLFQSRRVCVDKGLASSWMQKASSTQPVMIRGNRLSFLTAGHLAAGFRF